MLDVNYVQNTWEKYLCITYVLPIFFSDHPIRTKLTIKDSIKDGSCGRHLIFVKICKFDKGKYSNGVCCEENIIPTGSFAIGERTVANLKTCRKLVFSEDKNDLYFKLNVRYINKHSIFKI